MTGSRVLAWSVHAYTASCAAISFIALAAAWQERYAAAFLWLAAALLIDSTDGTLARRFRVKEVVPEFDGTKLDDLVDYLTYVFVPMAIAYRAGLLPIGAAGLAIGSLPLMASAYGFCQVAAKTDDHFFTGFPSYWNVIVVYMVMLQTPVWLNAVIFSTFTILVFVPIRYAYPSRNPVGRMPMFVLGGLWSVLMLWLIVALPDPPRAWVWLSLFFPAYYMIFSVYLDFSERRARTKPAQR